MGANRGRDGAPRDMSTGTGAGVTLVLRDGRENLGQLRDLVDRGAQHVSLSAPLHDAGTPAFAEAARNIGFFFSGLGPGFAEGGDALLMQWLGTPIDTGKLQIYSEQARDLVFFIEADRAGLSLMS